MKRFIRENSLSLVLIALFLVIWLVGQIGTGFREYNNEQEDHQQPPITLPQYLTTPHFVEATMENWESEFLQMFVYIVLTAMLTQKGSAESKPLDDDADTNTNIDEEIRQAKDKPDVPWPVRKGGFILKLYSNSLSLAFLILFLLTFWLHAAGGAQLYNEQQHQHGHAENLSTIQFMATAQFWFESFQNWQSEFLSVAAMVILSIYLRQKGSPESKPVAAPHRQTGSSE